MVESLPTLLTSQAEMERLSGAEAILTRLDDDEDDVVDTDSINDIMLEATDEVLMFCESRYNTSDLIQNRWVRRAATTIAVHLLSQRMGNSDQYSTAFSRIEDRLKSIVEGRFSIPRLTTAQDERPAMSNLVIDDRYARAKIREQTDISEGTTDGSQDDDWPHVLEP